jgi:hypothetical protein
MDKTLHFLGYGRGILDGAAVYQWIRIGCRYVGHGNPSESGNRLLTGYSVG